MILSDLSIKRLAGCDERLHVLAVEAAKDTPIEFIITHGYRTEQEQQALYAQGRTKPGKKVTNCDGIKKKSMHNYYPSKAFDFAAIGDDGISWDEHYYLNIGNHIMNTAKRLGINIKWPVNLGTKKKPRLDLPHIQLA